MKAVKLYICVLVAGYFHLKWRGEKNASVVVRIQTCWRCLLPNELYMLQQCSTVLVFNRCQMLCRSFYLEIAEVMVYFTHVIICEVELLFQGGRVNSSVLSFPGRAAFDCMNYHAEYQSMRICLVLHYWQLLCTFLTMLTALLSNCAGCETEGAGFMTEFAVCWVVLHNLKDFSCKRF